MDVCIVRYKTDGPVLMKDCVKCLSSGLWCVTDHLFIFPSRYFTLKLVTFIPSNPLKAILQNNFSNDCDKV